VKYRADIDGLRAIAVTLVLLFHAFPRIVPGGFIGVDVFFVISGFLITKVILSSDFNYATFYAHRARRLFPALSMVVAISLVAGWFLLTPVQFEDLGRQAMAAALFVPNLLFWSQAGYFDPAAITKPLLHLWSLGVEEQYYLFGPAILLLALRRDIKPFAALFAVIAISLLSCLIFKAVWPSPSLVFYWPIFRAWEIAAGGLIAVVRGADSSKRFANAGVIVGICAIMLPGFLMHGDAGWPSASAIAVVAGSMLLIQFGQDSLISQRWLASAPMVFIGKISYPLYLWHWPILSLLYLKNGGDLPAGTRAAALVASACLATATYLLIERPFKKGVPLKVAALASSSALLFVGTIGVIITIQQGLPDRLPAALRQALAYQRYDYAIDAYNPGCWLGNDEPASKLLPVCLQTSRDDAITIWGDSHAARLSPGLRSVFGANRISQLTRNGCAPILGLGAPASSGCKDGNDAFLEIIKTHKPRTLIMFGAWQNYTTDWRPASPYGAMLSRSIEQVKQLGLSEIILIGPSPRYKPDLPSVLLRDWSNSRWAALPDRIKVDMRETYEMDRSFSDISKRLGIKYVSAINLFCNPDGCLTKRPDSLSDLVTWDYGHLTTAGAIILANDLKSLIRQQDAAIVLENEQ
jgi:peptidoglycan/LPS O-acetylase OafA/YrhL